MIPPRIDVPATADRAFWPDELAAILGGLVFIGGLFLRALTLQFGLAVSWYAPASQRQAAEGEIAAWLGLALLLIPLTIWACRELGAGRTTGHVIGVAVGTLAPVAFWFDHFLWGWLFLLPLPIYCAARLFGWGPKPI